MQLTPLAVQRIALMALLVFMMGWYFYGRAHKPALETVNGVYHNRCCGDIQLKDGVIAVGTDRVPFDLDDMKFGLTVYPAHALQVDGGRVSVVNGDTDSAILVSNDRTTITLCGLRCDQKYLFVRK